MKSVGSWELFSRLIRISTQMTQIFDYYLRHLCVYKTMINRRLLDMARVFLTLNY